MKIAISGSAGTGKSTLAEALATRLGLPCIPEHYEALFDPPGTFRESPPEVLAGLFSKVLALKRAEEERLGSFIVDRCPADLLNLWLGRGLYQKQKKTIEFYRLCREYMGHYDYVIVLPWGTIPLKPLEKPTGRQRRVLNPGLLLRNHATIVGLVRMWLPGRKVIALPEGLTEPEARLNYILSRIMPEKQRLN